MSPYELLPELHHRRLLALKAFARGWDEFAVAAAFDYSLADVRKLREDPYARTQIAHFAQKHILEADTAVADDLSAIRLSTEFRERLARLRKEAGPA
jgi:hypothetical protein